MLKQQCPCQKADRPCRPKCACVVEISSFACLCCARYGNEQQRKTTANFVVAAVTACDEAGLTTEGLESGVVRDALVELRRIYDRLARQIEGPMPLTEVEHDDYVRLARIIAKAEGA